MPLHVPGAPDVRIESLPATEDMARALVEFYAVTWDRWYNGQLDARLDVPRVADPNNPRHVERELASLRSSNNIYRVARREDTTIASLAWLSLNGDTVTLEEWNTYPFEDHRHGYGSAVLAAALDDRASLLTARRLRLEVYARSPLLGFYYNKWRLAVVGKADYAHIGSGVPHAVLEGSIDPMLEWLGGKPRLESSE